MTENCLGAIIQRTDVIIIVMIITIIITAVPKRRY